MKEQLLKLIKELELLRAQALTDHDNTLALYVDLAAGELQWAYKYITEYE